MDDILKYLIYIIWIFSYNLKPQYYKEYRKKSIFNYNLFFEKKKSLSKFNILNNINILSKNNIKLENTKFLNSIFYKTKNNEEYVKGLIFFNDYNMIRIYDIYGKELFNIPLYTNNYISEIIYYKNETYYMILVDKKHKKILKYTMYFNNNYYLTENSEVFEYFYVVFPLNLMEESKLYYKKDSQSINYINKLALTTDFWNNQIKKLIVLKNNFQPHIMIQLKNKIVLKINIHQYKINNFVKINNNKFITGSISGDSIGINKLLIVYTNREIMFYQTNTYSLKFRCLIKKGNKIKFYTLVNKSFLLIISEKYFHVIKIEATNCYDIYKQPLKNLKKIQQVTTLNNNIYILNDNKIYSFNWDKLVLTRNIILSNNNKFGQNIKFIKFYNFNDRKYLIISKNFYEIYEISNNLFMYKEKDYDIVELMDNSKIPIFVLIFIILFIYNIFCYNKKSEFDMNNNSFNNLRNNDLNSYKPEDIDKLEKKLQEIMKMDKINNILKK